MQLDVPWWHRAACRGHQIDLFFPAGDTSPYAAQIKEAKAICARCPVHAECLQYALRRPEKYGIWAGLTEQERGRERRNRGRRVGAREQREDAA
jgi:WhiB family transcriptional regulator, redox-sensing transcriptional regulator